MSQTILRAEKRYLLQNYARPKDFVPVRGQGAYLFDAKRKKYLDFVAGIAVNALGHNHPGIVKAVSAQAKKFIHVTNLYHFAHHTEVAETLIKNSPAQRAFFCNSGTEAIEAAIKFARRFAIETFGQHKTDIITFKNGFHGRTLGALSATGQKVFHKNFGPLVGGFKFSPFNDAAKLKKLFSKKTCAVIVEFVQGEGGIHIAEKSFIKTLAALCKKHKALLIADEIQAGLGRTGRRFAFEGYGVKPDLVTLAKPLGGGFPLGAVLLKQPIAGKIRPGDHGTTFGGNPVASAAARVVLGKVFNKTFLQAVRKKGALLQKELKAIGSQSIKDVRGQGLMVGVELTTPPGPIVNACRKQGLLVVKGGSNTVRFLPPLIVTGAQIKTAVRIFKNAL